MKHEYILLVNNIGETLQTSNGFDALREYRRAIADSKAPHGRASGETVTLFRDGELWREYAPKLPQFFVEMTDTYGGEANYCWVNRFLVTASSDRGAIGKVTRKTGYHARSVGYGRYDVRGACVCYFVEWVDADQAAEMVKHYSGIEVI